MADAEQGGDRAYRHALSAHRGGFASAPVAFRSAAHTAYGTSSFHSRTSLRDRESPNVVSERLGHASVAVTLSIYNHVLPGDQKAAAARFAALVRGAGA
jgi:integrase